VQASPTSSGLGPSVETAVVEHQHLQDSGMPQDASCMDPMSAEVSVAVDSWVEIQGRKKAKLAVGLVVTSLHSPGVLGGTSPDIVHHDVSMVENRNVNRGKRQYMTCSRAGKSLVVDATTVSTSRAIST